MFDGKKKVWKYSNYSVDFTDFFLFVGARWPKSPAFIIIKGNMDHYLMPPSNNPNYPFKAKAIQPCSHCFILNLINHPNIPLKNCHYPNYSVATQ